MLRTVLVHILLAETTAAAQAKLDQMPAATRAMGEQLPVAGTPEEILARLRPLVGAGFQYIITMVSIADTETLQLLGRRVLPAFVAG